MFPLLSCPPDFVAMALKLGTWDIYRKSEVCNFEQTTVGDIPTELIVGSYVTTSEIVCLKQVRLKDLM